MNTRRHDRQASIDYDAYRAQAVVLRREAIDAFWHALASAGLSLTGGLAARARHALAWHAPHAAAR